MTTKPWKFNAAELRETLGRYGVLPVRVRIVNDEGWTTYLGIDMHVLLSEDEGNGYRCVELTLYEDAAPRDTTD